MKWSHVFVDVPEGNYYMPNLGMHVLFALLSALICFLCSLFSSHGSHVPELAGSGMKDHPSMCNVECIATYLSFRCRAVSPSLSLAVFGWFFALRAAARWRSISRWLPRVIGFAKVGRWGWLRGASRASLSGTVKGECQQ